MAHDWAVDTDAGELHLAVCRRFGAAVRSADGKWERQSPCAAWNARDVLEHVIGFHDVLLLRPLGLKPDRPRDDPRRRWESPTTNYGKHSAKTSSTKPFWMRTSWSRA